MSKGRILLPRAAVEANLSFAIGKAHSLIARDHQQHTWQFTLQSWANGGCLQLALHTIPHSTATSLPLTTSTTSLLSHLLTLLSLVPPSLPRPSPCLQALGPAWSPAECMCWSMLVTL